MRGVLTARETTHSNELLTEMDEDCRTCPAPRPAEESREFVKDDFDSAGIFGSSLRAVRLANSMRRVWKASFEGDNDDC